jgi:transposase
MLANHRQAFTPSKAKDDPSDAELLLELIMQHRNKLKALRPQGATLRILQQLVEQRRGLVDDKVRITNRLSYALKQYFPQALQWFKDKDTVLFCDFFELLANTQTSTTRPQKHAPGVLWKTQRALSPHHRRANLSH